MEKQYEEFSGLLKAPAAEFVETREIFQGKFSFVFASKHFKL